MKLVKRVSIYKGIKRIAEPHPASFKINQLFYNMTKPYRMTIQQELFKYGYKNYPYNIKFILLAIVALALGVTLEQAQRQLMKNQVQTIYSYKIGESTNSTIVMSIRRFFFWLYVQNLMCVLLPAHELILLKGVGQNYQQKFVRVGQYRYFQKHRDNKYDFLELGVLEKFPYPLGLKTSEAGM